MIPGRFGVFISRCVRHYYQVMHEHTKSACHRPMQEKRGPPPMNTGKILIGISLIMVSVAMIISPSNAAVPGPSGVTCPPGIVFTQVPGTYPGSADSSGVFAHALLSTAGTGAGQSSSL